MLEYAIANARLYFAGLLALLGGAKVLHLHNPPDTLFGIGFLARLLGRDVVFDHHDLAPELFEAKFGRSPVSGLLRLCERLTFRSATLVVAANESHREVAEGRGGVPAARIAVVRNGPPPAAFVAATEPRGGALSDPHLLFLGSMESQDGVDELLPLLEVLASEHGLEAARLTVVGEGSRRGPLSERVAAAGLEERVRFTGRVHHAEVPGLLAAADICVDPAPGTELNQRSTMVKIAEYMAAERAVVCSRCWRRGGPAARRSPTPSARTRRRWPRRWRASPPTPSSGSALLAPAPSAPARSPGTPPSGSC